MARRGADGIGQVGYGSVGRGAAVCGKAWRGVVWQGAVRQGEAWRGGLEAKNPAVILPDADLDVAVKECVSGALSFNGQRCTALKLIFVHASIADDFVARLAAAVDALHAGMPWAPGAQLTPLPEPNKAERLQALVDDATAKGARVVNGGGHGEATWYAPAVVYWFPGQGKGKDFAASAQTMPGTAAVLQAVAKDKNGIGYGGAAYGAGAKHLAIKKDDRSPAIEPSEETVMKGSYPIWRHLFIYVNPALDKGEVATYLNWIRSDDGQQVVKEVGYFPLPEHLRQK